MASQPEEQKNELVFLGINFNNFFKNCGCVKRSGDEEGLLRDTENNDALPILKPQKVRKSRGNSPAKHLEDIISVASSTDWTDLEEISLPMGSPTGIFGGLQESNANPGDDFLTQEPIDFEDLKKITNVDKEDYEESSSKSGLSRSSKKISKKDNADKADAKTKTKPNAKKEGKEAKEGKGKRNPWQPHEDAKVLELVAKYGQSWAVVASMMEGRTGKQIRDRFLNKLKANIRRGDWTPEEDKLLLTLYYQLGHKWSKIATYLPGRTEGQVKNRFYSHIKKKIDGHAGPDQYSGAPESLQSPEVNRSSPERDTGYASSPNGSTRTATTQVSRVSSDVQVNAILDKLTGYLENKNEATGGSDLRAVAMGNNNGIMQQQYAGYAPQQQPNNNAAPLDPARMEQLQHRRGQLEYLLAQTLREMGNMNGPTNENSQQGAWGGWS